LPWTGLEQKSQTRAPRVFDARPQPWPTDQTGKCPARTERDQSLGFGLAGNGDRVLQEILILVVEDDPFIQMIVEQTLHDGGYSTSAAASGEEALAMLETNAGYRALVTDISLGGATTGWDVAQRARELIPAMPVLYVTSTTAAEWTARSVPGSLLVQKPFAPEQIIKGMSRLLNTSNVPAAIGGLP
jgi:CheY-like chemotaxis protein